MNWLRTFSNYIILSKKVINLWTYNLLIHSRRYDILGNVIEQQGSITQIKKAGY